MTHFEYGEGADRVTIDTRLEDGETVFAVNTAFPVLMEMSGTTDVTVPEEVEALMQEIGAAAHGFRSDVHRTGVYTLQMAQEYALQSRMPNEKPGSEALLRIEPPIDTNGSLGRLAFGQKSGLRYGNTGGDVEPIASTQEATLVILRQRGLGQFALWRAMTRLGDGLQAIADKNMGKLDHLIYGQE